MVRGVKAGLKSARKKLSFKEFHKLYSHMGSDPNCSVCKMVKGNMRRIYRKIDPHREQRPGHTWSMDIVTFSDRSEEGCKYCIVLRDQSTGAFTCLLVARRTTQALADELEEWILQMRAKPIFANMHYKVVSVLKTDNERAWSVDTSAWQQIVNDIGVEMVYVEPSRHAQENGYAESAVKILEACVKSILMAGNLPPSYWQSAVADAEFLLNRFPVTSDSVSVPIRVSVTLRGR